MERAIQNRKSKIENLLYSTHTGDDHAISSSSWITRL